MSNGCRRDEVEFPLDRRSAGTGMNLLCGGLKAEHLDREGPLAFREVKGVCAIFVGGGGELLVAANGGDESAGQGPILGSNEAALRMCRRLG